MTTKELLKEVSRRVAAGESKKALFEHYRWTENEAAVVQYLPTQVSLKLRRRWRGLNWVLIACLVVVTLFKAFDVGCQLLAGRDLSESFDLVLPLPCLDRPKSSIITIRPIDVPSKAICP